MKARVDQAADTWTKDWSLIRQESSSAVAWLRLSIRFAISVQNVANCDDYVPQPLVVDFANRTFIGIEIRMVQKRDRLALYDASARKSKLPSENWDAIGQLRSRFETGRRQQSNGDVRAAIELVARNDQYRPAPAPQVGPE
jgi:predicted nucleotidyltransferase